MFSYSIGVWKAFVNNSKRMFAVRNAFWGSEEIIVKWWGANDKCGPWWCIDSTRRVAAGKPRSDLCWHAHWLHYQRGGCSCTGSAWSGRPLPLLDYEHGDLASCLANECKMIWFVNEAVLHYRPVITGSSVGNVTLSFWQCTTTKFSYASWND